jgi:hypothetical protein
MANNPLSECTDRELVNELQRRMLALNSVYHRTTWDIDGVKLDTPGLYAYQIEFTFDSQGKLTEVHSS